jgi:hypothetical protein
MSTYMIHWPPDEYVTPIEVEAQSVSGAKAEAIRKLANWSKTPLKYVDYIQDMSTGRKHYTGRGIRSITAAALCYLVAALLISGVIWALTDKPRTHRYELRYSLNGQPQPELRFKATNLWKYPTSVVWVNDNDDEVKGTNRTRLERLGDIDKGYQLTDLDPKP